MKNRSSGKNLIIFEEFLLPAYTSSLEISDICIQGIQQRQTICEMLLWSPYV